LAQEPEVVPYTVKTISAKTVFNIPVPDNVFAENRPVKRTCVTLPDKSANSF
jgi:hypothetical protein